MRPSAPSPPPSRSTRHAGLLCQGRFNFSRRVSSGWMDHGGRHVTTLGVVVAVSAWLSGQCTRAESRAPALSSKRVNSLLCVDAAGFAVARARPRVPPARSSSRCRGGCRAPVSCVDRREGFQLQGSIPLATPSRLSSCCCSCRGYGMASAMTTPRRSTGPLGAVLWEAVEVAGNAMVGDEAADRGRRHSGGAGLHKAP